jgi:hypothetical protein
VIGGKQDNTFEECNQALEPSTLYPSIALFGKVEEITEPELMRGDERHLNNRANI